MLNGIALHNLPLDRKLFFIPFYKEAGGKDFQVYRLTTVWLRFAKLLEKQYIQIMSIFFFFVILVC